MLEKDEISYYIEIYNDYQDTPIVIRNINNFDFNNLMSHRDQNFREFTLIVIKRLNTKENTTTITPIIAIYNKNNWKQRDYFCSDIYGSGRVKIIYTNRKQTLEFNWNIINIPSNSQEEMMDIYNLISNKLKTKKRRVLKRKKIAFNIFSS